MKIWNKQTYRGIKKETNIPNKEMMECRKCGGRMEMKYPNGYLTQFTCRECGENRILDATLMWI